MTKTAEQSPSTELVPLSDHALGVIESLGIRFTDTVDIQWRIAEQQALATSLDDLLGETGPQGLREHLGEEFTIRGVDYLKSSFPGMPLYAVISAVNRDGEAVTYTTGALSVVIQLARGAQMGWWPDAWVKAIYSTREPTPDGNRPYKLVKA